MPFGYLNGIGVANTKLLSNQAVVYGVPDRSASRVCPTPIPSEIIGSRSFGPYVRIDLRSPIKSRPSGHHAGRL